MWYYELEKFLGYNNINMPAKIVEDSDFVISISGSSQTLLCKGVNDLKVILNALGLDKRYFASDYVKRISISGRSHLGVLFNGLIDYEVVVVI